VSYLYELALLGAPSKDQILALEGLISWALEGFGLRLGDEVELLVLPQARHSHRLKLAW